MKTLSSPKPTPALTISSRPAQPKRARSTLTFIIALAGLVFLAASCATKPAAKRGYSFFPPAPDEPRVQFLASFSSDDDLGWNMSKFAEFATGKVATRNPLLKPYGIGIRQGKVFVCDTMQAVVEVFDFENKHAHYFAPRGEGKLQMPINISLDTDGTIYIADSQRGQVVIFRKNEEYIAAIGKQGEMRPTDVAITTNRLYVTDLKEHLIRVYSKQDRALLFTIPRDPKTAQPKLLSPTNLALDEAGGRLLVSDTGAFAVHVFDLEGKFLRTVGQQGVAPGLFARPKGVAIDRSGLIYVVDAATQVVQMFDAQGKLLMFFGQADAVERGDLHLPAVVKLDYDNVKIFQNEVAPGYECEFLILVTSQVGGNKVNVYGFLKKK